MTRIKLLSEDIAHKIAAGEVIERPASVVKELVENSIDAMATSIDIEVRDGGKEYIRVSDNGIGINSDDLQLAFVRHATSKINSADDLFDISSLGFRGEALASIASVSELTLKSRQRDTTIGQQISFDRHKKPIIEPVGMSCGTTVEVRRLFYNTPARYKFLKTTSTEKRYIIDFVSKMALAHTQIACKLTADNKLSIQTHGQGNINDTLINVFNRKIAKAMITVDYQAEWGTLNGYLAAPELTRGNRRNQVIVVNGRIINSSLITSAVEKAYHGMLGHRNYPIFIILLSIDPKMVDVNVHPTKIQVRLQNEQDLYQEISAACKQSLLKKDLSHEYVVKEPNHNQYHTAHTALDIRQYFPIQPQTWSKVDSFLQRETASEIKPIDQELKPQQPEEQLSVPRKDINKTKDELLNGRIIGQFRQTYIILETSDGLWLLDQHIIHERILYEQLKQKDYKPSVQQVLPHNLEFSSSNSEQIKDHLDKLKMLGVELEEFGKNSFLLRGIPSYLTARGESLNENDLIELVDCIKDDIDFREKTAVTLACKAAVKAGRKLNEKQINSLLTKLADCENPFTCPHGRPIIVKFAEKEINKLFGR